MRHQIMDRIYLDNHATTPLDPGVRAAIDPFLAEEFGNPASTSHSYGKEAALAVENARDQTAALIGADRREIVFTSGATEATNLALKGVVMARGAAPIHVITCTTEHPAVLDSARFLEGEGIDVSYVGVDSTGQIDLEALEGEIRPDTGLISVMAANNEIGNLQPIAAIGELARDHDVLFHCDAAQAVGKVSLKVDTAKVDLLSISAHKLYGPKGSGALYVRRDPPVKIAPLIHGGGHERGMRSGTLNVVGCVGLGEACQLAGTTMHEEAERLISLRERLYRAIADELDDVELNGHPTERLPGNLNLTFPGVDADAVMARCPELAVSSGSACSSATPAPSHVLTAIGLPSEKAECAIRFGIGRFNTEDEMNVAAAAVVSAVRAVRELLNDPVEARAA